MILNDLEAKDLIHPPPWLVDNVCYLTQMGSIAYGIQTDNSDVDLYGFCIPRKEYLFPHIAGKIVGFDNEVPMFDQWQQHHIPAEPVYDITVFNIARYFRLLLDNNPNIIDSVFTSKQCVVHCTSIGNMVRDNRKLFLHQGLYEKFRGYASSQLYKLKSKQPIGKRAELIEKHGWDTKFGAHAIRLLLEAIQLVQHCDVDLQVSKIALQGIRNGNWMLEEVFDYFARLDIELEEEIKKTKLPQRPHTEKVKQLLIDCLESHFGSLADCMGSKSNTDSDTLIKDIKQMIERAGY